MEGPALPAGGRFVLYRTDTGRAVALLDGIWEGSYLYRSCRGYGAGGNRRLGERTAAPELGLLIGAVVAIFRENALRCLEVSFSRSVKWCCGCAM